MNVLRKDVSNGKKSQKPKGMWLGIRRKPKCRFYYGTKPPISNGIPKSDTSDMEVFTEYKRF